MKKPIQLFCFLLLTISFIGFFTCKKPTASGGGGDDQGNAIATGKIYNQDGTPAANATVRFIKTDKNPQAPNIVTDSTKTDEDGEYGVDFLPEAMYSILAEKNGKLAYQDSVLIEEPVTHIPPDTLKDPGSLKGVVRLRPGDNSKTVMILVMGTQWWFVPVDSIGNFTLLDMAEGAYTVRFLSTLDNYEPLDKQLRIRAGRIDTLQDTIRLGYRGVPIPTGLKATYDTLTGIVYLSWDPIDTSLIDGYWLFRNDTASDTPEKVNETLIKENQCAVQVGSPSDTNNHVVEYRLKAQGKNMDVSQYYSSPIVVHVISPSLCQTTIRFQIFSDRDRFWVGDSFWLVAEYTNTYKFNTRFDVFRFTESRFAIIGADEPFFTKEIHAKSGQDTVYGVINEPGSYCFVVVLTIEDQMVSQWKTGYPVYPRLAMEAVDTAKVGSQVRFKALNEPVYYDGFEPRRMFKDVQMYKWDNGISPGWDDSSATLDQVTYTYTERDTYTVKLYMLDKDGYEDSATSSIAVWNDDPIVTGLSDTTITINDTVTFKVHANDPDGIRKNFLWDFDGNQEFDDSTGSGTLARVFPNTPQTCLVICAVRDTFDGIGYDTAHVEVLLDPPTANASAEKQFLKTDESIVFHAQGTDEFGTIVEYAWDFSNNGDFEYRSAEPVQIDTAFVDPGLRMPVLRVQDDDGNYAYDTLHIPVIGSDTAFANDEHTVALWRFDEMQGDTVYDASGNKNHGIIQGATWTSGKFGAALSFDGVDDYVKVPQHSSLELAQALTIECWVYAEEQNQDCEHIRIIRKSHGFEAGYILSWRNSGEDIVEIRLDNYLKDSFVRVGDPDTSKEKTGRWIYIAATHKDTTKLYINGQLVNSKEAVDFELEHTGDLYIGSYYWPIDGYESFKGNIDEIRISDKARTASEIAETWNLNNTGN